MNEQLFNLRIDKEGTWYYNDSEMFRKDIVNYFYQNLKIDEAGNYIIEIDEGNKCPIEVEDAPFVVKAVVTTFDNEEHGIKQIELLLNDSSLEPLNPSTLESSKNNILYCNVKENRFKARFSRAGYYQLAEHINYNEEKNLYYVMLKEEMFYIKCNYLKEN